MPATDLPKIDVYHVLRDPRGRFIRLQYLASTNRYRRCSDAANYIRRAFNLGSTELVGRFDRQGA